MEIEVEEREENESMFYTQRNQCYFASIDLYLKLHNIINLSENRSRMLTVSLRRNEEKKKEKMKHQIIGEEKEL